LKIVKHALLIAIAAGFRYFSENKNEV